MKYFDRLYRLETFLPMSQRIYDLCEQWKMYVDSNLIRRWIRIEFVTWHIWNGVSAHFTNTWCPSISRSARHGKSNELQHKFDRIRFFFCVDLMVVEPLNDNSVVFFFSRTIFPSHAQCLDFHVSKKSEMCIICFSFFNEWNRTSIIQICLSVGHRLLL